MHVAGEYRALHDRQTGEILRPLGKTREKPYLTYPSSPYYIGHFPQRKKKEDYYTQDERLVQVVPSPRQLAFQQTEFYAFVHFTVNTFTGREWGDGTEPESIFNPEKLDAASWVQAIRSARDERSDSHL